MVDRAKRTLKGPPCVGAGGSLTGSVRSTMSHFDSVLLLSLSFREGWSGFFVDLCLHCIFCSQCRELS